MGIFDQTGGGKSFSFNTPGDGLEGTVESFKVSQATKFDSVNWKPTNDPDFWPSGDAKMQVQINIQTQLNSGEEGDAGVRSIYATITSAEGTMFRAIQDAIKLAHGGVKADIEEGSFIQVWYSHDDPNSKNQRNPKKCYGATYRRPAGAFGGPAPTEAVQGQMNIQAPAPAQFQQAPTQQAPQQAHFPTAAQVNQAAQQQAPQQANPYGATPTQQAWGVQAPAPQQAPQQAPQYDQGGFVPGPPQAAPAAQQQDYVAPAQQGFQQAPAPQQDPWTGGAVPAQQAPQQGVPQPGFYGNQAGQAGQPAQAPAPQQGFAQAPPQQAAQPAPQAQQVNVDEQRVRALINAQMDDATIIGATGITPEALNLLRNLG